MELNLEKDLCFFDIESTGLSVAKDRIIQLAIIKVYADGRESVERCRLINPEMSIPSDSIAIHGITDEMVENQPTFKQVSRGLYDFIGDADLAGFNSNRFDVPMLMEEFERAGIHFDMTNRKALDMWRVFQRMEPRNLNSAYKFYCGKKLDNAHNALIDVRATLEVFKSQLDVYDGVDLEEGDETIKTPIVNDMNKINDFCAFGDRVDFMGRIVYDEEGAPVFNFGKYQNKSVGETLSSNPGYYTWIMEGDFPTDTKRTVTRIFNEYKANRQERQNVE